MADDFDITEDFDDNLDYKFEKIDYYQNSSNSFSKQSCVLNQSNLMPCYEYSNSTLQMDGFEISSSSPGYCLILDLIHEPDETYKANLKKLKTNLNNFLNFMVLDYFEEEEEKTAIFEKGFSKETFLKKFKQIQNENQIAEFSCFAVFIFGHGGVTCNDGCIEFEEIIDYILQNKALTDKPKLNFIYSLNDERYFTTVKPHSSNEIFETHLGNLKCHSEMFIFQRLNLDYQNGMPFTTNLEKLSSFIDTLCNVFQNCCYNFDLLQMAIQINNILKENEANLIIYSGLSRPVTFERKEELDCYPDEGRCVILNFDHSLDITSVLSSYTNLNFVCRPYGSDYLNRETTPKILERESQNSIDHCKCLVLLIYAKCSNGFLTMNDARISLEYVLNIFTKAKLNNSSKLIESCPKYIFVNSNSLESETVDRNSFPSTHYCQRNENTFISFNTNPVNLTKLSDSKNINMFPPINHSKLSLNLWQNGASDDVDDVKFKQIFCDLINSHFMNAIEESSYSEYTNNSMKTINNNFEISNGQIVVLYYDDQNLSQVNSITTTFLDELNFKNKKHAKEIKSFQNFLKRESFSVENNCFVLFIFADCTTNVISWKNKETVSFEKIIADINYAKLPNGIPKLIFIMNTSQQSVDTSFDLHNYSEFLLVVSRAQHNDEHFVKKFSDILLEHHAEYDLMKILHKFSLIKNDFISMKSTLSKPLFFKKSSN